MSGFAQEFPGKVAAENVDARSPEGAAAVKELGFQSHGLVIRSADGKVLWKQPDHTVRIEDTRRELQRLTTSRASRRVLEVRAELLKAASV